MEIGQSARNVGLKGACKADEWTVDICNFTACKLSARYVKSARLFGFSSCGFRQFSPPRFRAGMSIPSFANSVSRSLLIHSFW